jgi:hypothetical protein
MAEVIKSPRSVLLAAFVLLLSLVFLTAPTAPANAYHCTSATTNCNTWSGTSTCCNGGRNVIQKRTCCDWQQSHCCVQSRCSTALCPI